MTPESDSLCLLSALVGLLCSLRSATPPTTSAPRRQEYRGFPATISVRICRRVCPAIGQAEFGSGESEMWDERITRRVQREEGLVATALHEPISGATFLDHARDVPWEEFAPGEVISKVIRALEHTGCVAFPGVPVDTNVFRKEGEYWTISYRGAVVRLKDVKGLRYLAHLLHHPDREFHVVDLMHLDPSYSPLEHADPLHACESVGRRSEACEHRADPLLDAKAKQAYRRRLADLRENLREAESFGDTARIEQTRTEIEFLAHQLSAAVGLGGRDRATGATDERARVAVTLRIRAVLRRIRESHPALGLYLGRSIRTGHFCSYTPAPDHPIRWTP
jgi:hypothetical protein